MSLIFPSELGSDAKSSNYMGFYPFTITGGVGSAKSDRSYDAGPGPAPIHPIPVEGVQDAYANNWGGQEVSIAAMTGANITSQLKLGGKGLDEQGVLDAIVSKVTGGASSTALAAGNFASDVVTETATGWDRGNLGQSIENITGNMSSMIDKSTKGLTPGAVGLGLEAVGAPITQAAGIAGFKETSVIYGGPAFRQFSFSFSLKPLSQDEQTVIQKIVAEFQLGAAPQEGTGKLYRLYSLPLVYEIKFYHRAGENHALPKIGKCALQNIGIKFGGDRFQTFTGSHAPVQTDLTLQFIELEIVTKDTMLSNWAYATSDVKAVSAVDDFGSMDTNVGGAERRQDFANRKIGAATDDFAGMNHASARTATTSGLAAMEDMGPAVHGDVGGTPSLTPWI